MSTDKKTHTFTENAARCSLPASTGSAAALRLKIAELEEECLRLRRMARCPHEPIAGIGGTIQRLRQQKELSINQLAAASGVSKGQISRLERVENCNAELKTLERLATALGLKLSELILAYESEKPQNTTESVADGVAASSPCWALRRAMALRGWQSEDRLTMDGWGKNVGYSIWFSRWNWHGKPLHGNKACYHAHGYVSEGVEKIIERAAAKAKLAWKAWPDFPPDQLANGKLRESTMKPNR